MLTYGPPRSLSFRHSAVPVLAAALVLFFSEAMATEVWIVTDHQHPVRGTEGARVIELDAPAKIEAMLSTDLSAHPTQAATAVQQRLQADHGALAHQLVSIYQSVTDAWGIGITTIPAVVVVDSTRINDPVLTQEVADFTHDCYGPARARLFRNRPTLTDAQTDDVNWIGSSYFVNTAGYYDRYHSSTPRTAWPYDATRDAGLAQVASGGGYPSCRQWWSDSSIGLRARLLQQVDPDLLTKIGQWAGFLSQNQVDDDVIRTIVAPRQQVLNQGQVYADYGGQIGMTLPNAVTRGAGDVGLAVGALATFPAMDVVRQALPMVLSFLKMAFVICLPLVLVIGTYDLKAVVTASCVEFALFFVDFWFQLARWVDSTILDALYGHGSPHESFNPLMGLNNAMGDMLLNFVMVTMFLVLPAFWIAALGWAGVSVGNALRALNDSTVDAKNAGKSGSSVAMKALK